MAKHTEMNPVGTKKGKGLNRLFAQSTSSDGKTLGLGQNEISLDFNSSSFKTKGKVPRLKFPLDIDNDYKRYRSIDFYILKDVSYQAIINEIKEAAENVKEAFVEGGVEGALEEGGDQFKNILTKASKTKNIAALKPDDLTTEDLHAVISLPIPNILSEDDNHTYDENNLETAEAITGNFTKFYGETLAKYGDTIIQTGQQMINQNRRTSRHLRQMPVLNPFTWKKYKGSQLKEFRFTFFLVPRNKEEAEQVMRIVYTLKKYSYGSKNNTELGDATGVKVVDEFFISAPPKILLKFPNDLVNKMVNPGLCVISSISTTYQEGNTVGMTADGVPRFVELTIALLEFNQRFQEDFTAK